MLSGDRMRPAALIVDEWIVSLPFAPMHGRIDECSSLIENIENLWLNWFRGPKLR